MRSAARVAVLLAIVTIALPAARAQPPLSDDATGMTCRHYVVGGRLPWLRPGGDWVDAAGNDYGEEAFATQSTAGVADGRPVNWDITPLARRWSDGLQAPGAVLLRLAAGSRSWAAEFHSRENPDAAKHPVLVVEWSDGTAERLAPTADTYLSCDSHQSKGGQLVLRVGPAMSAVLVFPFTARSDAQLVRATLTLAAIKPRGNVSIGVFALAPPFSKESSSQAGLAARYPRDRGIERSPDVVFATRFESPEWRREWSSHGKGSHADTVVRDESNGFEPLDGKALKVTLREGSTLGLNTHYKFAGRPGGEPDEIYFRYYLRFGQDWNPIKDGGKLPGLSGTYGRGGWGQRRANGTNGWSARGSFIRQRPDDNALAGLTAIGSYVYHADMRTNFGEQWGWNLGPAGLLERDRWYSVEQYVRLNSPGANDGVLRAWIDGFLVFERTDLRFRAQPELKIESVWMNVYHGGTAPSPSDMSLYIDNVVVARRYIGPMAQ